MFKTFYIAAATVSAVSIQSVSYQPVIVPTTTTTTEPAALVVPTTTTTEGDEAPVEPVTTEPTAPAEDEDEVVAPVEPVDPVETIENVAFVELEALDEELASVVKQVEEILTGEGDKAAKVAAVKALVENMTVQDVMNAITQAEAAGVSIEAVGDFLESQLGKISKEDFFQVIKGACGKFEMDQDKLDALLKHIVETFELSEEDLKKIVKFLGDNFGIAEEEFKDAKEMCFADGKAAKEARLAAN
jgi:hypothetical protein